MIIICEARYGQDKLDLSLTMHRPFRVCDSLGNFAYLVSDTCWEVLDLSEVWTINSEVLQAARGGASEEGWKRVRWTYIVGTSCE